MLRYRINTKNSKKEYVEFNIEKNITGDSEGNLYIALDSENKIVLHKGDEIAFSRIEKDDIVFYEEKIVKDVQQKDGKTIIVVENFKDYRINVGGTIFDSPYLYFFTKEKHFSFENRTFKDSKGNTIYAKESLPANYDPNVPDFTMKRCPGDYIVFNNLFLYQASGVNSNNRYEFNRENYLNKKDTVIVIYANEALHEAIKDYESGDSFDYDKEKKILYLKGCITPSLSSGKDNRNALVWLTNSYSQGDELAQLIVKNSPYLLFYVQDDRFIKNNGYEAKTGFKCVLKDNVAISKKNYSIVISNVFPEDFSTNLIQEELLKENYVKQIEQESKNPIIDYEKQIFEPVLYSGGTYEEPTEIDFILNFRKRIGEEWKVDSSSGWNRYELDEDIDTGSTKWQQSDLLGNLNFSDEDVYFRKNKLTKSFLRLSFYDTQSRATQNLLFTSTIFMKEGELYSNYLKDLKFGTRLPDEEYVSKEDAPYRLDSSFKCKGKYSNEISVKENHNSNYSSEGYYLYLFPNILKEEGTTIYMKVEFNHARYGYTIPFVMFNDKARASYEETKDNKKFINMSALFNDMYIPILLKYDKNKNRYTWGIQNSGTKNMEFHLFEPRINNTATNNE